MLGGRDGMSMADSAGQAAGDWTEPGLFTVAPGVHRIPLPLPNDGLRAVNVYAIESGDDLVLVDARLGAGRDGRPAGRGPGPDRPPLRARSPAAW